MIAARALGYGTVHSQDTIPYELIKKVFAIPDNFERICFTPIGIPDEWPVSKPKKPLREFAVFERFIEGVNFTAPVTRTEVKLAPEVLKVYAGVYELDQNTRLTISVEDGRIFGQITGQARFEIFAESDDHFFLKTADVQLVFQKNDDGIITEVVFHQGGSEFRLTKTR